METRAAADSGAALEPVHASHEPGLEGDEEVLSLQEGGDQHKKVASVLNDLAKTARSFILYDPRNNAIHNFLATLLDNFKLTLERYGAIHIDVQPFEMWYAGVCVYLNRDRERSMSFRLYRDGVRELTFQQGFDWEEMAKLLEILSIRYSGVHQNEDDTVTLLWKANFRSLDIVAVEGYVPDDDEMPDRTAAPVRTHGSDDSSTLPDEVDLPAPRLPDCDETLQWVDVGADALEALRQEAGSGALPHECVQLIRHLSVLVEDPRERLTFGEVSHIYQEVLSFLMSEEYLPHLVVFLAEVRGVERRDPPSWDGARRGIAQGLLKGAGDLGSVRRLLRSITAERARVSPELLAYLDENCADPLDLVSQVMGSEHSQVVREVGRQLLEHYGKRNPLRLQLRFKGASGHIAVDLLRAIARVGGDGVAVFIANQTSHADRDVQSEALGLIASMPYNGAVGKALAATYRESERDMRKALLPILQATGDARFAELLEAFVAERGAKLGLEEALEVGRAMGELGRKTGEARWREALTAKGWLRKQLPGTPPEQVAAAAALAEVDGEDVADVLRGALKVASPEAGPFIGRAMMRHQKRRQESERR